MKIYIKSIEVVTDFGLRTVHLSTPIAVDPTASEMPSVFRSLTDQLWSIVHKFAIEAPEFMKSLSKAEA